MTPADRKRFGIPKNASLADDVRVVGEPDPRCAAPKVNPTQPHEVITKIEFCPAYESCVACGHQLLTATCWCGTPPSTTWRQVVSITVRWTSAPEGLNRDDVIRMYVHVSIELERFTLRSNRSPSDEWFLKTYAADKERFGSLLTDAERALADERVRDFLTPAAAPEGDQA